MRTALRGAPTNGGTGLQMPNPTIARCPTCKRRHKRSLPQNARLWAIYTAMSCKLRPGGEVYSPEHYHLYYKQKFLGAVDFKLPNGKVLTIPNSTADLDVAEFNEFMERVEADAAEHGVWLEEGMAV